MNLFFLTVFVCFGIEIFVCKNVGSSVGTATTPKGFKTSPRTKSLPVISGKKVSRERYYSKSLGEPQFNKYRGQLPTKGAIVDCAIQCFSLSSCHCIGVNIQTSECSFFGHDDFPPENRTMSSKSSEYLFFTRDIYSDSDMTKVALTPTNRKLTTSFQMEHLDNSVESKLNKVSISAGKKRKYQSAQVMTDKFQYPWIQFEFKEPMYITKIRLSPPESKKNGGGGNDDELRDFSIRVGHESIVPFYSKKSHSKKSNSTVKPFEGNTLCYQYDKGGFFSKSAKTNKKGQKQISSGKSVKCQPCGVTGKYLTIQAFQPCIGCYEAAIATDVADTSSVDHDHEQNASKQMQKSKKLSKKLSKTNDWTVSSSEHYPIPVSSIEIYGYPLTNKN